MNRKLLISNIGLFGVLVGAILILYYEYMIVSNEFKPTPFIAPLEFVLIGVMSLIVYYNWKSALTQILLGCYFMGSVVIYFFEVEEWQPYFTKGFALGSILFCFVFCILGGFYYWAKKPESIMDHEVIEVKPIS